MSDSIEASMMKRIGELKAENARLKAECQARQAENSVLAVECDSLKAEVERLTLHIELDEVDRRNGLCCDAKYRFEELEEQVERLTKAGDAMASGLQGMAGERPKALADEWNEAKGVQS